jgi:three-Cys-motif partner protein
VPSGGADKKYRTDPADGLPTLAVREWAHRKHHYLERYADIFSVGMKNRWGSRAYLDLFAGPGRCWERDSGEFYDGSPLIGLRRNFTDHVYVELAKDAAAALDARCSPWKRSRSVHVLQGDCNEVVGDVVSLLPQHGITFAFLDPTNWQITFSTIRQLAEGRQLDLLVSFFAPSMKRVFALHQPRLDAFFGTESWKTDPSYLGTDGRPTLSGLLACYRRQLATIGYVDQLSAREIVIKNTKNVPIYLLAFFSKHPKGYEFWDKITPVDEHGQMAIRW